MNLHCSIIEFKQTEESPSYLYFCSDREIKPMDYYINPNNGDFWKLQLCLTTHKRHEGSVKVEASNNPKIGNQIPQSFIEQYNSLPEEERPVKAPLRIDE